MVKIFKMWFYQGRKLTNGECGLIIEEMERDYEHRTGFDDFAVLYDA